MLFTWDLSEITSKILIVARFLILEIQTICKKYNVRMFMPCLSNKCEGPKFVETLRISANEN